MKGNISGGTDSRQEKKELQKANNAMKSAIHQKLVMREKEKFDLQNKVDQAKSLVEEMADSLRIYENILAERKRSLANAYLAKSQEDLERILKTLNEHFQLVQLTSFETMSKDNADQSGSKEILFKSNKELKRVMRELNHQKIEKDDIRYDIFKMIYEMIADNIVLRLKINNYIEGILEQTNQKLDRYQSEIIQRVQS